MSFGLEVYNEAGIRVLGMEDFTIERIFTASIPKRTGRGSGWRTDYIEFSVPGYRPETCFVVITPAVYAGYDQPGYDNGWGYTPVYTDIGNDRVAIIDYCNYELVDFNGDYKRYWKYCGVSATVEVVRVI